jgi:hypothetical protein
LVIHLNNQWLLLGLLKGKHQNLLWFVPASSFIYHKKIDLPCIGPWQYNLPFQLPPKTPNKEQSGTLETIHMELGLTILKTIRRILGPMGWESRFDFSKEKEGIYLNYTEEVGTDLITKTSHAILQLLNDSGTICPPDILKISQVQTIAEIKECSGKEVMILTETPLVSLVSPAVSTPNPLDQPNPNNHNELISGMTQIFVQYNQGCIARITLGTGGHTIDGKKEECPGSVHMGISVGHPPGRLFL